MQSGLARDLDEISVQYGPRRPVPTKLDPYTAILETRLTAFPALSAVRLFEEIRPRATRAATPS